MDRTIAMLRTAWGSPNGIDVYEYRKGATLTVPEALAEALVGSGAAQHEAPAAAPQPEPAAPVARPAIAPTVAAPVAPEAPAKSAKATRAPRSLSGSGDRSLSAPAKGEAKG